MIDAELGPDIGGLGNVVNEAALRSHVLAGKLPPVRALTNVAKVLFGLTLGLLIAEGIFWARDDGAFPHLNLYVADAKLGVRLRPNASMKLTVASNNPVTTVSTNSQGYRAPEWPAPSPGELVVVGDSQVFGLGVETNETFTARLAELLKVNTLNAGVPTYGPREYAEVAKDLLRSREVGTVVYVINLSNDLFEVDRPNLQRHTVWDGWAVRSETAPASVTEFPFRQTLMSRSHLVFALRKWLASTGQPASEGFATEGSWKDVVQASSGVVPLPPEDENARKLLEARAALGTDLEKLADQLGDHLEEQVNRDQRFAEAVRPLAPKGGDPRDILEVRYAEGARRVDITAYNLFMASIGETRNEALLEKIAKSTNDPELQKLIEQRRALRAKLDALKPEGEPPHVVPIERVLTELKAACDAAGARLLVVALPLDVMVSGEEWKKYGTKPIDPASDDRRRRPEGGLSEPIDMEPTRVLAEDVVTRAERIGAIGLDPTDALRAAEPGAFLDGDLHLTPKGHLALAKAIADALKKPPKPKSELELPAGRSWLPTEDEWRREKECTVKGSTKAGCETKLVREWLRVRCIESSDEEGSPEFIEVLAGGHGDTRTYYHAGATLVIPVVEGDSAKARFLWGTTERQLNLEFPRGGALSMAFTEPVKRVRNNSGNRYLRGPPVEGDPLHPPSCPPGQHVAGALRRCAPSCPCDAGHCEPWPTGDFCAVP